MIDLSAIATAALKPLWAKLLAAAIPLALIAAGAWIVINRERDERLVDSGREAGAATVVIEGQKQTLDQSRKANEARNDIRNDRDNARYDECLRSASAATRDNCVIFQQVR